MENQMEREEYEEDGQTESSVYEDATLEDLKDATQEDHEDTTQKDLEGDTYRKI